ncbi:MAG: cell division protein ZapE [Hyphomonadaceae bacterium]|nr:cell division protein ZapE [Hyphomonadaceae bacterium]
MGDQLAARVAEGALRADPEQARAAAWLDAVADRIANAPKPGWFSKPEPAKGLYLWGGVGRGKSMLMDLFFASAPVSREEKKRVHFHEFMAGVHDKIGAWRALSPAERRRSQWRVKGAGEDPIAPTAKEIATSARLLCFDEFQVTQIADAMILSRLFEALFARGVTVVATSNRHPDALYKNGINRELFTPFIAQLKAACEVHELASARDYRLEHLTTQPVWHAPLGPAAEAAMDEHWTALTLGAAAQSCTLTVKGRQLEVPQEAAGVARMSFESLCARPLGASDYLALASTFHTLMLDAIPTLGPENRNEAARFVALIDALYEAKTKLIATSEAEPEQLYPAGDGAFEFERTVSRLHEMRSEAYLSAEHEVVNES